MSYQQDIFEAVKASAALTALVGDRFFWDAAEQGTATPYLVAQVVSGDGTPDFDGKIEIRTPLVQVTAWAKGKADAIALIHAFANELEGRNLPGSSEVSLHYSGEQSTRDPVTKLYGEIRDFRAPCYSN